MPQNEMQIMAQRFPNPASLISFIVDANQPAVRQRCMEHGINVTGLSAYQIKQYLADAHDRGYDIAPILNVPMPDGKAAVNFASGREGDSDTSFDWGSLITGVLSEWFGPPKPPANPPPPTESSANDNTLYYAIGGAIVFLLVIVLVVKK